MGYDVHKLVEKRDLILGGVKIPYELGLLGHSDADVLVHAIMDALLGAAALGDIGKHFPDTDDKYKISNRGRIKSYTKCNAEILKGYQNQAGYDRIDLIIDGKRQTFLVHRLVAAAFLPMPERLDY